MLKLKCDKCSSTVLLDRWMWRHECGGTLTYEVDLSTVKVSYDEWAKRKPSIARYRELLPPIPFDSISVGEGCTPIVEESIGEFNVYFKLEYLSPTGSFKDRGSVLAVSLIKTLHPKGILVEDSSGNAGISVATYSMRAGLRAVIFVPSDAPEGKKALLKSLGATLVEVEGGRDVVRRKAIEFSESSENRHYVGHNWNPFFIEGIKTIAFEIAEYFKGKIPDYVVALAGSGTLLLGIYKGFRELLELNLIEKMPSIIAVQASGYDYLCRVIGGRRKNVSCSVLADGIRVPEPPRLGQMAEAVRESGGFCVVVEDKEIIKALKFLVRRGFIVEPTSAAALAGLWKAREEGLLPGGTSVVVPLTGSGLKMSSKIASIVQTS